MMRVMAVIVSLGLFCNLAAYSYGRCCSAPERLVWVWKTDKAATIADIWSVSPDLKSAPMVLTGQYRSEHRP